MRGKGWEKYRIIKSLKRKGLQFWSTPLSFCLRNQKRGASWLGIMSRLKGTGRNVGDRTQKHFSGEMPALFVTVITREDLLLVLVDQGSESIHVELLTTMSCPSPTARLSSSFDPSCAGNRWVSVTAPSIRRNFRFGCFVTIIADSQHDTHDPIISIWLTLACQFQAAPASAIQHVTSSWRTYLQRFRITSCSPLFVFGHIRIRSELLVPMTHAVEAMIDTSCSSQPQDNHHGTNFHLTTRQIFLFVIESK